MKKRILHVITTLSVGGAEIHLRELLGGLSRAKYHIELAYFKEEAQEARSMVPDFENLGIQVHDLGGVGRINLGALVRLFKLVRAGRFDLLHSHLFRADLYSAAVLLPRPRTFLINSVHNPEDFYTRPLVAVLARLAGLRQKKTIVISKAVEEHLLRFLKIKPSKLAHIYYGLKPRTASGVDLRAEYDIPAEAPLIGTIGRLSKQKGHPILIDAMSLVCQEFPEARLLMVGHDDQGLQETLVRRIREHGLVERIILAGFRDEVPEIMASLDLFCLPSLWEGFGMVLIEAMAESKPIVASRVGSIPEVVRDNETGLLIPPGNPEALAQALVKLLRDRVLARNMGRAGRARLEANFTRETMIRSTERLYDQLLSIPEPA